MAYKLRPVFQDTPIYQTILSATTLSSWINIGEYEGPFSIQVVWESGTAVNMSSELEVSNDGIHFSTYPLSNLPITGANGNNFYDIAECGANFMRVKIVITGGSATISTLFNGKARV